MKKIIILGFAIAITIAACKKKSDDSGTPNGCTITADYTFVVDSTTHQTKFTNASSAEAALFTWSFGDNTTASTASPNHAYTGAGTYSVKLSIMSADGKCTGEVTKFVNVPLSVIAVPTTFTKKVILEEFTGAWCGYCPRGVTAVEAAVTANGARFIPIGIHSGTGEIMKITAGGNIDNQFNDYGYPGGMVDRITVGSSPTLATNVWASKITSQLATTAQGGLAIDARTKTADTLTVVVYAGFKTALTGEYRLNVYVTEGSIINANTAYDQHNYMGQGCSSPDPSSPWYTYPCVIHNFEHKHVLRAVATTTSVFGNLIPSSSIAAGKGYLVTYKIPITGMDVADLSIVAFVDKNSGTSLNHGVVNAQIVKVGSIKNWD